MSKITQKQMAFYLLWKNRKTNKEEYIPTWRFVGEIELPELKTHVMMSYKCPTRLTDLFQENDGLLERTMIKGKSGANYYGYRLSLFVKPEMIKDAKLKVFYERLKKGERYMLIELEMQQAQGV